MKCYILNLFPPYLPIYLYLSHREWENDKQRILAAVAGGGADPGLADLTISKGEITRLVFKHRYKLKEEVSWTYLCLIFETLVYFASIQALHRSSFFCCKNFDLLKGMFNKYLSKEIIWWTLPLRSCFIYVFLSWKCTLSEWKVYSNENSAKRILKIRQISLLL